MRTAAIVISHAAALLAIAPLAGAQGLAAETVEAAEALLRRELASEAGAASIHALAMTEDPTLQPLLRALCDSGDRRRRIVAIQALGALAGEQAAPAMRALLQSAPDAPTATLALNHLVSHELAGPADVRAAMRLDDPALALLAGRAAIQTGQPQLARRALTPLLDGGDPQIVPIARLLLLHAGDPGQLAPLQQLFQSEQTEVSEKLLLMNMIESQRIAPAATLIETVLLGGDRDERLVSQALAAGVAVAPRRYRDRALDQLAGTDNPAAAMTLLDAVLESDQPLPADLATTAASAVTRAAAALEQARRSDRPGATAAAAQQIARLGHPVLVRRLLERARQDADPAYAPALVQLIRAAPARSRRMQPAHQIAIAAAQTLLTIGGPGAVEPLRDILAGPYNAISRSVASALAISDAPAAGELAGMILESPYEELAVSAALAMGRAGDARGAPQLAQIVQRPHRYPPNADIVAAWYLLHLAGRQEMVAAGIAAELP